MIIIKDICLNICTSLLVKLINLIKVIHQNKLAFNILNRKLIFLIDFLNILLIFKLHIKNMQKNQKYSKLIEIVKNLFILDFFKLITT